MDKREVYFLANHVADGTNGQAHAMRHQTAAELPGKEICKAHTLYKLEVAATLRSKRTLHARVMALTQDNSKQYKRQSQSWH